MKKYLLPLTGLMMILGIAGAEVLSFSSGYDLEDETQLSLDAGYSSGDVDTLGVRVNYRLNPDFLVFGAIGSSKFASESDLSFGAGILYTLPDLGVPFENGVKVSFFRWSSSIGHPVHGRYDLDINEITVRYVVSGNIETVDKLKWFGEIGLHFLSSSVSYSSLIDPGPPGRPGPRGRASSYDDTELGLEAGLLYDLTEDFTGILSVEAVDKTYVNLAVRYKF
ncbi:MAG: hypothetical protein JJU29_03670 [Verrucomicrobia bacterium]|nr:hypothetical protein [Verrucomicrobiota bacterium]